MGNRAVLIMIAVQRKDYACTRLNVGRGGGMKPGIYDVNFTSKLFSLQQPFSIK